MAYDSQKGYNTDPNFDYSNAIRNAASEEEKSRLTQERQNKINDRYNGQEPNLIGKDYTFSQEFGKRKPDVEISPVKPGVSTMGTGAQTDAQGTQGAQNSSGQYNGTNYHQDAIDAAAAGDWTKVYEALAQRDQKTQSTGQNYGRTSQDILAELIAQYGQSQQQTPQAPQMPQAEKVDTSKFKDYLDQWLSDAQDQQTGKIDYATEKGVQELQRAEEDAKAKFQTQRDQVDADEARAKDNQALYAEARGDKGGIGQAQYDSIMNTAAQNRLQVNSAQTKLSTDTARQIADLRAQGEFEKADALLTLSQNYLSQLMSLEQWALEYNLSVDQFNASLEQWKAQYEMQVSEITGTFRGSPTFSATQAERSTLASAGEALLKMGIMPSADQLAAMGLTDQQAKSYVTAAKLQASAKGSKSGKSSGSSSGGSSASTGSGDIYQAMYDSGIENEGQAYNYLLKQGYKSTDAKRIAEYYTGMLDDGEFDTGSGSSGSSGGKGSDTVNGAINGALNGRGNGVSGGSADGQGMNESYFNAGMSSMRTALRQGRTEGALSGLESMWPKLSAAQKEQAQKLLAEYGLSYREG